MVNPATGAGSEGDFRLSFDPRVRLDFHGSKISSGGGVLLFRELDEALACMIWRGARCGIRGPARTGSTTLSAFFVSPPLVGWPDTLMSTMRIGFPVIQ